MDIIICLCKSGSLRTNTAGSIAVYTWPQPGRTPHIQLHAGVVLHIDALLNGPPSNNGVGFQSIKL